MLAGWGSASSSLSSVTLARGAGSSMFAFGPHALYGRM